MSYPPRQPQRVRAPSLTAEQDHDTCTLSSSNGATTASSSSAHALYQTLAHFTRVPPRTVEALGDARTALVGLCALSRSKPLFSGRWDLVQIGAAVSRGASAGASDWAAAPLPAVEARGRLVAAVLDACPLSACARLSTAMAAGACTRTPLHDWLESAALSAVVRQLRATSGEEARTAWAVVLSLLHDVHVLAATILCVAPPGSFPPLWEGFEVLSSQLGSVLVQLGAAPAAGALRAVDARAQNSLLTGTPLGKGTPRPDPCSAVVAPFAAKWLAVVMDSAAQAPAQHLDAALRYLTAAESCASDEGMGTDAVGVGPACLRLGGHHEVCTAAWRRLRSAALALSGRLVAQHHAALEASWTRSGAAAQLRSLLVGAPRHLADNFLAPLGGGGPQRDPALTAATLRALTETAAQLPALDVDAVLRPLRSLRRAAASLPTRDGAAAQDAAPLADLTGDEYRAVVRPAAVLALREGDADAAVELLEWAAPLKLDEGWRCRLQPPCVVEETVEDRHHSVEASPAASAMFPSLVAQWVTRYSGAEVLDAVVRSADTMTVADLRCLCHALLHQTGPWAAAVLSDPFAYNVPFVALARLVHALLTVGDLPLARTYLSALCACLAQRRSKRGVGLYVEVLARFARTIAGAPLYAHRPVVCAAQAAWVALADADALCAHRGSWDGVRRWLYAGGGAAFDARRDLFASLSDPAPPPPAAPVAPVPVTVVTLRLHAQSGVEQLIVERRRLHDAACEEGPITARAAPPLCTRVVRPIGAHLRAALEQVTAVMRENRLQLALGCTTTEATGATNSTRHDARRTWWDQRFQLERRLHDVVAEVDAALGPARALLCGDLAAPLREAAWTLSVALSVKLKALLHATHAPAWAHALFTEEWNAVLFAVVQALPLLNPPLVPRAAETAEKDGPPQPPSYPLPLSPCCVSAASCSHAPVSVGCRACRATQASAVDALVDCLEEHITQFDLAKSAETDPSAAAAVWAAMAAPVRDLCADTVSQLLHRLVTWQQHTAGSASSSRLEASASSDASGLCEDEARDGGVHRSREGCPTGTARKHVDVYRLPREHVHLVLDGSLHLLPWECTDALRWFSASRVPSIAYVRTTVASACRLRRVHFAINEPPAPCGGDSHRDEGKAGSSRARFAALLARHPQWTVSEDAFDASDLSSGTQSSANSSRHSDSTTGAAPPPSPELSGTDASPPFWSWLADEGVTGYVYVGHKTGEHLIPRVQLLDRSPHCPRRRAAPSPPPLVCLMGCSSAFLTGGEAYEGYGMPWAYLHAGTASLVGCLWDITDRDADRLTAHLLCGLVGATPTPRQLDAEDSAEDARRVCSVGEALAQARLVCKLPYLSGSAVVLYGVNTLMETIENEGA